MIDKRVFLGTAIGFFAVVVIASAAVYTVPPDIAVQEPHDTTAIGMAFNAVESNALTMNSGTFAVTNTGNGNAVLIQSLAGAKGPAINISSGQLIAHDENTGSAMWLDSASDGADVNISGGTFTLWENGHDPVTGFGFAGTGSTMEISGGTFSVEHWYSTPDGALFQLDGDADITVSGGEFQLDGGYPFPADIDHNGTGTFWLDCLVYNPDSLIIDGDGHVSDLLGTVSGILKDGSPFSFTFSRESVSTLKITGMTVESNQTFYVSGLDGDDVLNDGTLASPFKTISRAADLMGPGSICFIREGIYRETVSMLYDEVTLQAYSNEHVVISGCDLVDSTWEPHANGIMKTAIGSEVKQVFVNGARQNLARWPNEDAQQNMLSSGEWQTSDVENLTTGANGTARVEFTNMASKPADYWVGGYYTGRNNGTAFTAAVGKIIDSETDTLMISELSQYGRGGTAQTAHGVGFGYIINHLNALDTEREWVWKNNTLYFQPESGLDLNQTAVEVRTRQWGIDLDGRSGIVLEGISLHAASITMANSTDCVVNNCSVRFPSAWSDHNWPHDYGGVADGSCGVYVSGSDNVISNSYIAHSWGSCIRLEGTRNTLTDSIIEDAGWNGRRMSPVQFYGTYNLLTKCTVREAGRDVVDGGQRTLGFGKYGQYNKMTYNRISDGGRLMGDTGLFYQNMQGSTLLAHLEIAYNEFHNQHSDYHGEGVYVDNGTSAVKIHHNFIRTRRTHSAERGIKINDHSGKGQHSIWVINNTVVSSGPDGIEFRDPTGGTHTDTWCYYNIHDNGKSVYAGVQSSFNSSDVSASEFVDAAGLDYRLTATSAHIDPVDGSVEGIVDVGTNAWKISDDYSDANPLYEKTLSVSNLVEMHQNGWEFEVVVRAVRDAGTSAGFCGWGATMGNDPGWGLTDRERVGFSIQRDSGTDAFKVTPTHGGTITLSAGSAADFHTIRCVGTPLSSQYEFFLDGVSRGMFDIKDGSSNSGYDDQVRFESGSTGGTGRETYWSRVQLEAGATSIAGYDADAGTPASAQDIENPADQGWTGVDTVELTIFAGINDNYSGTSPDRGAYEFGMDSWTVGSTNTIPPDYTAVDTDGDSVADLEELALGFDPLDAGSHPDDITGHLLQGLVPAASNSLGIVMGTTEGWLHTVSRTDNLVSNVWKPFVCNIPDLGSTRSVIIPTSEEKSFFRVGMHPSPTNPPVVFSDSFDDYIPVPDDITILNDVAASDWGSSSTVKLYIDDSDAESGDTYIQFLGATGGGSMWLDLPTESGAEYLVNVALTVAGDNAQQPRIIISATGTDAQTVPVIEPFGTWQYAGYAFTATGTTTIITFTEPDIETSVQAPRLDSVKIFKLP